MGGLSHYGEDSPLEIGTEMGQVNRFVLATHIGTWLCINEQTGQLNHVPPDLERVNLVFIEQDGKIVVDFSVSIPKPELRFAGVATESLEVSSYGDSGNLTIRINGLYASAEAGGRIHINRREALGWEMFVRVPLGAMSEKLVSRKKESKFSIPDFPRGFHIPKTIHQTYMTTELPPLLKEHVQKLRRLNQDYEYKLWTDKDIHDFIYENYGYGILDYYLRINRKYGACRADLFRYLCLYKCGGVYLDIKSTCDRPFSNIIRLEDEYLLSQWENGPADRWPYFGLHPELSYINGGEFQQWYLVSAKGHPFLKKVIESVLYNIKYYSVEDFGCGKMGALRTTGPIVYTAAIESVRTEYKHRFIKSHDSGLVYNKFEAYSEFFVKHYAQLLEPVVNN